MKKSLLAFAVPFVVFFLFGGPTALLALIDFIREFLIASFPVLSIVTKQKLESHVTSPYFITGVILNIAALFGVWFGKQKSKIIYAIVSVILTTINALPIIGIFLENQQL